MDLFVQGTSISHLQGDVKTRCQALRVVALSSGALSFPQAVGGNPYLGPWIPARSMREHSPALRAHLPRTAERCRGVFTRKLTEIQAPNYGFPPKACGNDVYRMTLQQLWGKRPLR